VIPDGSVAVSRGSLRWVIVCLTLLIAAIAYLDRSNIAIAASFLKRDLRLSDVQLGVVFSAFVFGYAIAQPFAGRFADHYGPYRVVAVGMLSWCVLTALTASIPANLPHAFMLLLAVRFTLGLGESVIFPASNRLIANWMPSHERGLANGLLFAGVGLGAGTAPPLITFLMLGYGWRAAFWASSAVGLVGLAAWLLIARDLPERHSWIRKPELDYIVEERAKALEGSRTLGSSHLASWWEIIGNPQVVRLTLSYFCFGYVGYIFFTWFFTYMSTVRGLDLKSTGMYGMLPFIAMALASPFGGFVSDRLTRRYGSRIGRCRLAATAMVAAAVFVAAATQVRDARLAAVVLAAGSGSLYFSISCFWALSADIGRSSAGAVAGVINTGGQLGGTVVAALTPILAQHIGWSGSFLVAAAVALLGGAVWLFIDPTIDLYTGRLRKA
jgi:MFS transporter, ACS family, glucarate transporter